MGMCGGDPASNEFKPPEWTAGRYEGAMGGIDALAQTPYSQYQGMTVAEMAPLSHTAAQLTTDAALYGDPLLNTAQGSLMNIAGGGAMNPYLDPGYTDEIIGRNADDMSRAYATGTAAQNDAMAARQGAFGGSAWQERTKMNEDALADSIGDMATKTRLGRIDQSAGLFSQDRAAAMQAAGMAPQFTQLAQSQFDAMNKYGQQQQNYLQSLLTAQRQEFDAQQAHPFTMADWYLSALNRASGGYGESMAKGGGGASPMAALGAGMSLFA